MSTHIIGIVPPDEDWKKMKAIYDAYMQAGLDVPSEIMSFFEWDDPDPDGVLVDIRSEDYVIEYHGDINLEDGFQIEISKIPEKFKYIRFTNSW